MKKLNKFRILFWKNKEKLTEKCVKCWKGLKPQKLLFVSNILKWHSLTKGRHRAARAAKKQFVDQSTICVHNGLNDQFHKTFWTVAPLLIHLGWRSFWRLNTIGRNWWRLAMGEQKRWAVQRSMRWGWMLLSENEPSHFARWANSRRRSGWRKCSWSTGFPNPSSSWPRVHHGLSRQL